MITRKQRFPFSTSLRPFDNVHALRRDFTEFEMLGETFVATLASAFIEYSSTLTSDVAHSSFRTTRNFLRWVAANRVQLADFVNTLRSNHRRATAEDWAETVALWQVYMRGVTRKEDREGTPKYTHIENLNTLLEKLFVMGVIPKFELFGTPKQVNSPMRPFDDVHGRYFDFTEFEGFGKFVSELASAFVKYSSTVSLETAQTTFRAALNFLRWVASNQRQLADFVTSLRTNYRESRPGDWEAAVGLWQDHICGIDRLQSITKYNLIKTLNGLLKKLFMFGVLPKFDLVGAPKLCRGSRPTKTLAEVAHNNSGQQTEAVLNGALLGTTERGIELEIKRDFLKTLIEETGSLAGTPRAHAKLLMKINSDRLTAVRRAAEKDFTHWLEWWKEGQCALRDCDMSFEEIGAALNLRTSYKFTHNLFPIDDPQLSLRRLLTYFAHHPTWRGLVNGRARGTFSRQVWVHVGRLGGIEKVQARMFPHMALTNAIITLVLCDTGANVTVARTLLTQCLDNSEIRGYKVIKGNKMRAGGKLIANELPINDSLHEVSCIHAIQTYQKMSEPMRRHASEHDSKLLFLQAAGGTVHAISSPVLERSFREFCGRHDEISNLRIQPKMIRSSLLMQAALDKETGIVSAAAVGDHSSMRTTNLYVSRYPTRVIWERMIREFQALFQVVSIYSIKEAARKLGLTRTHIERLFSEACRTGLGVACIKPKSGIQPGSEKGKTCTQLQNCPTCPNRIVVATVENLRDLILWNHHLEQNRTDWELTRPEKWERDWLPWLVFTRVVIEQAQRGRTVPEFKKASVLANDILTSGELNLPPLW